MALSGFAARRPAPARIALVFVVAAAMLGCEAWSPGDAGAATTTYVSNLTPTGTPVNGFGPWEKDKSNGENAAGDGKTLTLNGATFTKGLGVHAPSDLRFAIPTDCTTFTAQIGIDDEVASNGSVIFRVIVDGTTLFTSSALTGASAAVPVSVPVTGKTQLRLVVDTNGIDWWDHADWADAKFTCGTSGANQSPVAAASGTPLSGTVPFTVVFSSAGSSDPDGSISSYAWDLDGDGQFDDSTAANPSFQYTTAGSYTVRLRVTDNQGAQTTSSAVNVTATVPAGSTTTYVSNLTPTGTPVNGFGPWEKDKSNGENAAGDGKTLTLNGATFTKGIGVHAASDLRFAIPTGCTTFTAQIGIDDEVASNGSVIFRVLADTTTLFTSSALTGASTTVPVSVPVTGRTQLRLIVATNGTDAYDHADWADAKFTCGTSGGGNQPPIAAASGTPLIGTVPFTVAFSSAGSSDPDGSISSYAWDLDGDGQFDDSTAANPSFQYTSAGSYTVRLRVTDNQGAQTTSSAVTVSATGTLGFASPFAIATGSQTHSVIAADVDGDQDKDLVAAVAGSNAVAVTLNNGSGGFGAPTLFPTGTYPKHAAPGDINGDGKLDLVTANQEDNTITVLKGNGDGTFQPGVSYPACVNPHQAAFGDLNGDGRQDVAVACFGGSVVSVLLSINSAGTLGSKVDYPAASGGHSLVLKDFDGDGDLDVAEAALFASEVTVLTNNGAGALTASGHYAYPSPHNISTADLNGDGTADLVATSQSGNTVGIFLGNGNGTFRSPVSYPVGSVPKATSIGDLNGDGKLDLATANSHDNYPNGSTPTTLTILLGNGNGTFTTGMTLSDNLTPFSVAIADFNGDGKNDLATANWHSGDIKVFRHT